MTHRTLALLALLALGCADAAHAQGATSIECAPTSTRLLEGRIQDALDESGLANVGVLLERDDGRRLWVSVGTPNSRYTSHSTAKPVMSVVVLDLVAQGRLGLTTRAVDVIPAWQSTATGPQRDVEVRHLLAMTSGFVQGPACWQQATLDGFAACVDGLPALNAERVPGGRFHYSTTHLDILARMASLVTGQTWEALVDDWRGRTGLFPGLGWNRAMVAGGGSHIMYTAEEYLDFLDALDRCEILTPRLCALAQQDQHPWTTERNSLQWYTAKPDGSQLREDWRFGFGLWIECAAQDWSCPYAHRISSYGAAGQYALIERQHRYRAVITPSFGPNAGLRGYTFARDVEPLLEEWAALGRL